MASSLQAFRYRDFRYYLSARFLALAGNQMLGVALGQYLYEITKDPLQLGYLGLALFLPKLLLTLPAGHVADHQDRRNIIVYCRLAQVLVMLAILAFYFWGFRPLFLIYGLVFLQGAASAFDGPAGQALVTQIVPREHFANAVTWNAWTLQIAFILGPALAGYFYLWGNSPEKVFYLIAFLRLASFLLALQMKKQKPTLEKSEITWESVLAGLRYIQQKKILLGIISLDLFAVLLGGVVALVPFFANDILGVGASGTGILRAATAVGAAVMSMSLTMLPPFKKAGPTLLIAVAVYGIFTIFFGISKNYYFSILCLFILGAADTISVVIRGVLVQLLTPPEMRGRVSAVNLIFIGASNELGEFESGLTASWFGVVPAVILGGIGTLLVVLIWSYKFPDLKNYGRLDSA